MRRRGARELPDATADHVAAAIDPAYLGGYDAAMLFTAGLALVAAVATLAFVRRPPVAAERRRPLARGCRGRCIPRRLSASAAARTDEGTVTGAMKSRSP